MKMQIIQSSFSLQALKQERRKSPSKKKTNQNLSSLLYVSIRLGPVSEGNNTAMFSSYALVSSRPLYSALILITFLTTGAMQFGSQGAELGDIKVLEKENPSCLHRENSLLQTESSQAG